ncbi:MAG: DUF475 domain-containing protein [Spirochaetia bacterium]|jgi:hypothetical protein
MSILGISLTILGLAVFETVSSVDNAIINAEVLSGMGARARRWFLVWGLLFAVFVVRGLLPWLIVWLALPAQGPLGAFVAAFSSDALVVEAVDKAAPILLMGGGVFLVLLFLHWLFLEPKQFGLGAEKFFTSMGAWFFAVASVFLALTVWFSLHVGNMVAFSAVVGSTLFFITHGFKENAEAREKQLVAGNLSDLSKILYLEIIDMTFSIDGVLGAFAFTLSVPIIVLGNGLGALVVRQVTVGNIERIRRLRYIKNGAMYSILFLGAVMMCDGLGVRVPQWVSPAATFVIVGVFVAMSLLELRNEAKRPGNTASKASAFQVSKRATSASVKLRTRASERGGRGHQAPRSGTSP